MLTKKDSLFIKGLAVFLLLFHHNPNGYNSLVEIRSGARVLVWLFLFVTAYGFSFQMEKGYNKYPLKFIIKRLALIYFPMWIMYLINLAAHLIVEPSQTIEYFKLSPINLPLDILSLSQFIGEPGVAGYWYVGMLFIITVLYPVIYKLVNKTGWFSILIVYALTVIDPIKVYNLEGRYLDSYLLIVVIGTLLQQKKVFEKIPKVSSKLRYPCIILAAIAVVGVCYVRYGLVDLVETTAFLRADPISTFLALFIVMAVFLLRKDGWLSTSVEWIGNQSGNFYYIHGVFYNLIIMRSSIYNRYVSFILCFVFTLAISFTVEFIKKKTNYNDRLKRGIAKALEEDKKA